MKHLNQKNLMNQKSLSYQYYQRMQSCLLNHLILKYLKYLLSLKNLKYLMKLNYLKNLMNQKSLSCLLNQKNRMMLIDLILLKYL